MFISFPCKLCGYESTSVKLYIQHCRIHSNLPKLRFPCCFRNCLRTSSSFTGLRVHLSRSHSTHGQSSLSANLHCISERFSCSVSTCLVETSDKTELEKHLRRHINDGLKVGCSIKGCCKKYHNASSLSCHLSRDHSEWTSCDVKKN